MIRRTRWIAVGAWLIASGCGDRPAATGDEGGAAAAPAPTASAEAPSPGAVDSVFPMPVMLERFRKGLAEPTRLEHGAASRDALVGNVVAALQASDTARFEALAVDVAEFAWLYFPTTSIAKPPYELPPALAWFRLQEGNRKGVFRALRELGGRRLELKGYRCAEEPSVEGANRIWGGCTLTLERDGAAPVALRLFDSILERDGRFAILSYANDF